MPVDKVAAVGDLGPEHAGPRGASCVRFTPLDLAAQVELYLWWTETLCNGENLACS